MTKRCLRTDPHDRFLGAAAAACQSAGVGNDFERASPPSSAAAASASTASRPTC